jgi:hypothetical protein
MEKGEEMTSRKTMRSIWSILGVVGIIAVLVVGYSMITGKDVSVPGVPGTGSTTPTGTIGSGNCPDTGATSPFFRLEDTAASTLTYASGSRCYLQDVDDNTLPENGSSSSGTSHVDMAGDVNCPGNYKTVCVAQAGTYAGAESEVKAANGQEVKFDLETVGVDHFEIRVKDLVDDAFEDISQDNKAGVAGHNGTTYDDLNMTNVFESAATDFTVNSDGELDLEIWLRSGASNKFVGGDMPCWLTVDVGTDVEWAEPSVSFDGQALSDTGKADIDKDSLTYGKISSADYTYQWGSGTDIGRTTKKFGFNIKARSGQDPDTSNDDVTLCWYCSGRYLSSDEADTIKSGIATDASTQADVMQAAAYEPCAVLMIS